MPTSFPLISLLLACRRFENRNFFRLIFPWCFLTVHKRSYRFFSVIALHIIYTETQHGIRRQTVFLFFYNPLEKADRYRQSVRHPRYRLHWSLHTGWTAFYNLKFCVVDYCIFNDLLHVSSLLPLYKWICAWLYFFSIPCVLIKANRYTFPGK